MKKNRLFKTCLTALISFLAVGLYAQDIILEPAQMIPHDTGYYIGGVYKDKNEDGSDEFYNGCKDEYGDANHNESGEQFGFIYENCMIMPTCWPKDAVEDNSLATIDHAEGYIELTKSRYPGTDSANLGYIITPPLENLESMTLEVSADVSSNDSRHIYYWIEYTKDNMATWELTYIQDETTTKTGDNKIYDGTLFVQFEEMKTASTEGPIRLRIMSTPQEQPQRVKVHYIKIVADEAVVDVDDYNVSQYPLRVMDNVIYANEGKIEVYSVLGQFVGSGEEVHVRQGIYVVKTANGNVQKVIVK